MVKSSGGGFPPSRFFLSKYQAAMAGINFDDKGLHGQAANSLKLPHG
jgi:hypothetical protein